MSSFPSVSMLLFCYLVLQWGSSSPQAPYKRSLSFKHTQRLTYFPLSPGRLTTCQRHASGEQDLRLTPRLSVQPSHMHWGVCGYSAPAQTPLKPSNPGNSISNRAHFLVVSGCGVTPPTPPTHKHTHHHLLYFYQAPWSSHLLLPGNPILFGVCDEGHSPSPHWSRAPL